MTIWRCSYLSLFVAMAAIFSFPVLTRADSVETAAPTTISPDAHQLLDQLRTAYSSLKSLGVSGTMKADFDIDGVKAGNNAQFTGLYCAGGLFRSEMGSTDAGKAVADSVAGNTGDKIYIFLPAKNRYDITDAPKAPVRLDSLGDDLAALLCQQDLSLAFALASDPSVILSRNATTIIKAKNVDIDGQPHPALSITGPQANITIIMDPTTHLLRRAVVDQSKIARQQGAQVIKSALITTDYVNTPGAPAQPSSFAWAPPPGAQPLASENTDAGADIEGKPAPAFELTSLDGSKVNSDSLKGSVFVLDFWATWCGPCVASLPHLDGMYKDFKAQGVRFFAINLQEDKDTVQKFVTDSKLGIPVLLDSDGKVAEQYDSAGGIPFTVVVGKDGKVLKAGFFGGNEDQLPPIIQAALKK